jgi:hypothetical protein
VREVCNAERDDIQDRIKEKDAEIERLKALLVRAAKEMEEALLMKQHASHFKLSYFDLIDELRKAAAE